MQYREYIFSLITETELSQEIYSSLLCQSIATIGFESFIDNEPKKIKAFLPETHFKNIALSGVYSLDFPNLDFEYSSTLCPNKNWNEIWEKESFKPTTIKNKLYIKAPYHPHSSELLEINISPKNSFGSGMHPTTQLMLEAILEENFNKKNILDLGCGTGILGITALLLGGEKATFIDIDSSSTENTLENINLNPACIDKDFLIKTATLESIDLPNASFDFVFSNIHRNIILDNIPHCKKILAPNGILLLSGFYKNRDTTIIQEALSSNNFAIKSINYKEDWAIIIAKYIR